jgi:hypothetical protein
MPGSNIRIRAFVERATVAKAGARRQRLMLFFFCKGTPREPFCKPLLIDLQTAQKKPSGLDPSHWVSLRNLVGAVGLEPTTR